MAIIKPALDPALYPGQTFAGRFEVIAFLGAGALGEVYRARDVNDSTDRDGGVALKILRTGEDPEIIRTEYENLKKIYLAEGELGDGLHTAPRPITFNNEATQSFLAMEFIRGQRVQDILEQVFPNPLDEPTALNIAAQLFRLFDLLHRRVKVTYTDLKFENLWWQPEPKGLPGDGVLKVTDWNVLGKRPSSGSIALEPEVIKNLFDGTLYLYHMLTGTYPTMGRDNKVDDLDKTMYWEKISSGTQQFLLQTLLQQYYPSASRLRHQVQRLLDYWQSDPEELTREANALWVKSKRLLELNQQRRYYLCIVRARERVTVAMVTSKTKDKRLEYLAKELCRDDSVTCGELFAGGSLGKALEVISAVIPRVVSAQNLRWLQEVIIFIKQHGLEKIREPVAQAYRHIVQKEFVEAEKCFQDWVDRVKDLNPSDSKSLVTLHAVLSMQSGLQKAEGASTQEALSLFQSILEDLEKYPETRTMLPNGFESTAKLAFESLQSLTDVQALIDSGLIAFKQGSYETALADWKSAFKLDPDNGKLFDIQMEMAEKMMANPEGDRRIIRQLLDVPPTFRQKLRRVRIYNQLIGIQGTASGKVQEKALKKGYRVEKAPDIEDLVLEAKEFVQQKNIPMAVLKWGAAFQTSPRNERLHNSILDSAQTLLDSGEFQKVILLIENITGIAGSNGKIPGSFGQSLSTLRKEAEKGLAPKIEKRETVSKPATKEKQPPAVEEQQEPAPKPDSHIVSADVSDSSGKYPSSHSEEAPRKVLDPNATAVSMKKQSQPAQQIADTKSGDKRETEIEELWQILISSPFKDKTLAYKKLKELNGIRDEGNQHLQNVKKYLDEQKNIEPTLTRQPSKALGAYIAIRELKETYNNDSFFDELLTEAGESIRKDANNGLLERVEMYFKLDDLSKKYVRDGELLELKEMVKAAALKELRDDKLHYDERKYLDITYLEALSFIHPSDCSLTMEKFFVMHDSPYKFILLYHKICGNLVKILDICNRTKVHEVNQSLEFINDTNLNNYLKLSAMRSLHGDYQGAIKMRLDHLRKWMEEAVPSYEKCHGLDVPSTVKTYEIDPDGEVKEGKKLTRRQLFERFKEYLIPVEDYDRYYKIIYSRDMVHYD